MPKTRVADDDNVRWHEPNARPQVARFAADQDALSVSVDGDGQIDEAAGDYGAGVIRGISIATIGPARGWGQWIDAVTLQELQEHLEARDAGVRSRWTHPEVYDRDGLGLAIGRVRSPRLDGNCLRGDLHLYQSARITPYGDLGRYLLTAASEDSTAFGMSVVFHFDWQTMDDFCIANGGSPEAPWAGYRSPDEANHLNFPHARVAKLEAVDVVGTPAANPTGLFTRSNVSPTVPPVRGRRAAQEPTTMSKPAAKPAARPTARPVVKRNRLAEFITVSIPRALFGAGEEAPVSGTDRLPGSADKAQAASIACGDDLDSLPQFVVKDGKIVGRVVNMAADDTSDDENKPAGALEEGDDADALADDDQIAAEEEESASDVVAAEEGDEAAMEDEEEQSDDAALDDEDKPNAAMSARHRKTLAQWLKKFGPQGARWLCEGISLAAAKRRYTKLLLQQNRNLRQQVQRGGAKPQRGEKKPVSFSGRDEEREEADPKARRKKAEEAAVEKYRGKLPPHLATFAASIKLPGRK